MVDATTPPLPQTTAFSPQDPQQSWNMSVLDMPPNTGALDGQTRANALALAMQGQNAKIAPMIQATTGPNALPAWDPNATSLVGTPAGGTPPPKTGLPYITSGDWLPSHSPQAQFDSRMGDLAYSANPNKGVMDAIHNWMSGTTDPNAVAGQQAEARYNSPEAKQYFAAHPSLLAAAEADPVNFAVKLGPILDAATARAQGKISTGQIVHSTIDGPMIKPDDHPEMTVALAKAHGITPQQAHAGSQSHHYTEDEFVHAMRGATRGSMRSMWEMQHYLDPTNQAKALALGIGAQRAQAGGPGSDAAGEYYRYLQTLGLGPQIYSQPPAQR